MLKAQLNVIQTLLIELISFMSIKITLIIQRKLTHIYSKVKTHLLSVSTKISLPNVLSLTSFQITRKIISINKPLANITVQIYKTTSHIRLTKSSAQLLF